ncbi:Ig-like domain repeat protein [Methanobrevibacter sp.]|uniref:Ig-like domain-containing protein n=1 Tax=Methanobrevibacter sp. TaxID=66852 RepID=UPI0038693FA3
MNFKRIILVSIFLLAILTIGSVSANDNMTEELSSIDEVTAEIDDLNTELTEENEAENGTFADLNQLISESEDSVVLKHDYSFNSTRDEGYKSGIVIQKSNLVIDGAGHTIDGKGLARMFNVTGTNVAFKNIQFINGYTENKGGALYITGDASNIINCTFTNNKADDEAGAVFINSTDATIKDSKFINNSAINEGGGAIFWNNAPNGQIINSKFYNNTAKPDGGAVFIKNATNFQIIDSAFDENNATGKGGAVYWLGGDGTFIRSTFNRNYAEEDGGAIYLRVQNGIIKDSNFTSNNAFYNGAVYMNSIEGTVINCIFTNNTATDSAGALGWVKKENGTIADCTFKDNSAPRGGAIFLNNGTEFYISSSVFENNNASQHGGAIFWDSGNEGRIGGCTFKNNYAGELGGAICWNNTENGYIHHSQFDQNKARDGGAIYFNVSNGLLTYSNFANNTAYSGGAIYNSGTISIKDDTFTNNRADDGNNDIAGDGKVKYNVDFEIDTVDNEYGKTVKIIVTLISDSAAINNGTVSVILNNTTYKSDVRNSTATIEIPNLNAGNYDLNMTYTGDSTYNNYTEKYNLIITKQDVEITGKAKSYVINYGGKYSVTVKGLAGAKVIFRLSNKVILTAITDKNGIASITFTPKMLKTAKAGKKNLLITLDDANYRAAASYKITINKEKTKMTAKAKAFKRTVKTKKYTITLKNSKGKAVKKVKVTLKVNGKTYKATTNAKGKATFKITKLTKRGKFTAKINFKENAYYKASSKKVKITIR